MWYTIPTRILLIFLMVLVSLANSFFLDNADGTTADQTDLVDESRKRKKKFSTFTTLVLGALLVKMIIFPLAVKAMAVMATVSVLLSAMSWITSAIVGFMKVAARKHPHHHDEVQYVHPGDVWSKSDYRDGREILNQGISEVGDGYQTKPNAI